LNRRNVCSGNSFASAKLSRRSRDGSRLSTSSRPVRKHVHVRIENGVIGISALRNLPMSRDTTAVHRLEIPYGRFERRIALPPGRYELLEQACMNGCLVLRLATQ
jgi:hypothetical protein